MGHYKGECPKLAGKNTPRGAGRGRARVNTNNKRKRTRSPDLAPAPAPAAATVPAPGGSGLGRAPKNAPKSGTTREPAPPGPTPSKQGRIEW